jgi:hypothetical protein
LIGCYLIKRYCRQKTILISRKEAKIKMQSTLSFFLLKTIFFECCIAFCLLPFAYCLLPFAYCLLPTAFCLLPIAYCLLLTAYCLLPIAYCLLPYAYCLLPISCCLLPTAYCLLNNFTIFFAFSQNKFDERLHLI